MGFFQEWGQELQAVKDRRNISEIAAKRFDAIGGDQAAYWAKSLRANPRAALAMADQYGGFGEIETNLRGAQARGRAVMTGDMFEAYKQDPEDFLKMQQGLAHGAKANAGNAEADRTRSIWGGGVPVVADQGELGIPPNTDDIKMKFALESGDAEKVQAVEDRARYGGAWKGAELDTYFRNAKKQLLPLNALSRTMDRVKQLDPKVPLDVLEAVNYWQKRVDEGAVVRDSDVKLINMATVSGFDSVSSMLQSYYDANKAIPEAMGSSLIASLSEMLDNEEDSLLRIAANQDRFGSDQKWNAAARNRALPMRAQIDAARSRQQSRSGGGQGSGGRRKMIHGVEYQKVDGGWARVK